MKNLYLCLTDFQILNALNLQLSKFKNKKADLFFITNKEGNEQLAERLASTGIFEKIYLFNNSRIQGLHQYVRSTVEGKTNKGFAAALVTSVNEAVYKLRSKFSGEAYRINAKIVLGGKMDFAAYDEVFCLDKRSLVVDCVTQILKETGGKCKITQILKETGGKCKINLLDEGTSTYWRSILKTNFPVSDIYLYAPELANYYSEGWRDRIYKIPQIDYGDEKFRAVINKVFDFKDDSNYPHDDSGSLLLKDKVIFNKVFDFKDDSNYPHDDSGSLLLKDKVIFFDQNWDPMPEYFKHLNKFMMLLLHNPYKKHKKESAFYERKMQMFRITGDNSGGNDVIVKLHPRSPLSFVADYNKSKCTMAPNLKIPWEVFMDNCRFNNNIWVTVSSTALCTYKMIFADSREDIPMIFLYKIVYDGNKSYQEDDQFFRSFQKKYPQSVFIPETIEEFTQIYKKLIIKMDNKRKDNK